MNKDFWEKAHVCGDEPLSAPIPIMAINYPKPRKIVEYKIADDPGYDLGEEVRAALKEGWQPWGNMQTTHDGYLYQALVKYEE